MSLSSPTDILNTVMYVGYIAFFIFSFFFSTRIRTFQTTRSLSKALTKISGMRDKAKQELISALPKDTANEKATTARVDKLMQFFTIKPSTMDPKGVTHRFEHVLDNTDQRVKDEIKAIAPQANEQQLQNLQNMVEVTQELHKMYKVVRQYYIMGKKGASQFSMVEIEMQLPNILEEAEAYSSFIEAFKTGKPIGDGIGPLTAQKLMAPHEKFDLAQDTVGAETSIEGRRVIVMKAKGPGGTVGKTGDGITKLMEMHQGKIALVIMVDAALKLEGEESGSVSEGVGPAIGGPGLEQFKIEEAAAKYKVPVYAVVVKQTVKEALAPMTPAIEKAADDVAITVRRVILERTNEADTVVIVGVGNTMGVAQ
ncbi:MAG: DUF1512 family protein [Candidatus Bathyarchaeia archaeon]|jgi:hypothetical protein